MVNNTAQEDYQEKEAEIPQSFEELAESYKILRRKAKEQEERIRYLERGQGKVDYWEMLRDDPRTTEW